MKLLLKGGRVIDPAAGIDEPREVLIDDNIIEAILPPGAKVDAEIIDVGGCWVAPGLIDMHVHLREPGEEYKETVATGAAEAAAGGITAVACMANTRPVNDCAAVTDYIIEKARAAGKARVYPVGAVSRGLLGEGLSEMGELVDHGCVALSDDGHPVAGAALMRCALEYAKALHVPILSHPEEKSLSENGSMHEGEWSTRLGLRPIPAAAEEAMVARDILLAEQTGGALHLQHLSTAGSVRLVREAKARGLKITAETCPHYFTLTDADVRGYDPNFKMNPPLRSAADRDAVIVGLADGTIDAIASDHAPHSPVEKDLEFDQAANGIVGLATILPLSLRLVADGKISAPRLVELLSANPARILGVAGGSLKVGAVADLTVIDPEAEWQVDKAKFLSKGRNTPFDGLKAKGRARMTLVGGKKV